MFSVVLAAESIGADHLRHPGPPCWGRKVEAQNVRHFAERVWAIDRWKRGAPPERTIRAFRHKLRCAAGPGHRKAAKRAWRTSQAAFYRHRKAMLWRARYRRFEYPDGSHWAVPYPIAWCESGGDYFVGPSGAYGLIPPFPQYLPPKRQDEIAYNLYLDQGEGPWRPYEGGCAYR